MESSFEGKNHFNCPGRMVKMAVSPMLGKCKKTTMKEQELEHSEPVPLENKPLGRLKATLYPRLVIRSVYINVPGHMTKTAYMSIHGENL